MDPLLKNRAGEQIRDPIVASALRDLDRRLKAKFGDSYSHLILFGSRARGDHNPDSDADVAVVMRGEVRNEWALTRSVLEDTYELLLDTGLFIEPWVIEEAALGSPESGPNPALAHNIVKDGRKP